MNFFGIKNRNIINLTILIFSILNVIATNSFAQAASTKTSPNKNWKFDGTFLFHVHESTFTNWASGGDNQLATKMVIKPSLNYDNGKWSWENTLDLRYGQQRNAGNEVKKNEDEMIYASKLGKRFSEKWKFSSFYSFNSQFTPYRENGIIQSAFMAPAYTNLSIGFDYVPDKKYSIYMTPLNMRNTWVLNDSLSARGEYMVKPGSNIRFRFGSSFLITYKGEILKIFYLTPNWGIFRMLLMDLATRWLTGMPF
ncbi:MAG TPA: DUF3078 domain-containing protein [Draconibacterium sp.]|nr:DUF3078 domain-containing protein [Draconibacterium sp.]